MVILSGGLATMAVRTPDIALRYLCEHPIQPYPTRKFIHVEHLVRWFPVVELQHQGV